MPIFRTPTGPSSSPRPATDPPTKARDDQYDDAGASTALTEHQRLLTALFSRVPGTMWVEHRFISQGGGRPGRKFTRVRKIPQLRIRAREGVNIYFGVLPRLQNGNGRAEGVTIGTALWLDMDGAPLSPSWWGLPEPTAVVCSSPGKYQAFWLLETPTEDLDRIEECNAKLAQLAGGDPAVFDRARILRAPGYPNAKYSPAPVAQLVDLDADRVYSLDELEARLPELATPIGPRRGGGGDARDRRGRLEARSVADQQRFAELWRLGWGLEIRPGVQAPCYCVFHESQSGRNDLSIDASGCVWKCFSCQRSGGLGALEYEAKEAIEEREWRAEAADRRGDIGQADADLQAAEGSDVRNWVGEGKSVPYPILDNPPPPEEYWARAEERHPLPDSRPKTYGNLLFDKLTGESAEVERLSNTWHRSYNAQLKRQKLDANLCWRHRDRQLYVLRVGPDGPEHDAVVKRIKRAAEAAGLKDSFAWGGFDNRYSTGEMVYFTDVAGLAGFSTVPLEDNEIAIGESIAGIKPPPDPKRLENGRRERFEPALGNSRWKGSLASREQGFVKSDPEAPPRFVVLGRRESPPDRDMAVFWAEQRGIAWEVSDDRAFSDQWGDLLRLKTEDIYQSAALMTELGYRPVKSAYAFLATDTRALAVVNSRFALAA